MAGQHRLHRDDPAMRTVAELRHRAELEQVADAETQVIERLDLLRADPEILAAARGRLLDWSVDPEYRPYPCRHCPAHTLTGYRVWGVAVTSACRACLPGVIARDIAEHSLIVEYEPHAAIIPAEPPTYTVWCDWIGQPADTRWSGRERYCQHCGASDHPLVPRGEGSQ